MPKPLYRPFFAAPLLYITLLIGTPLAHASEIKVLMKDMKHSMRGAMASKTIPELSGYVTRLERDVQQASRQNYRSDQATYNEGMQTLGRELTAVDQEIHANNLTAAKQALRKINDSGKHYHHLLN